MANFQISDDMEIVRDLLRLTTKQLADEIGVSRPTLNNWSKGITKISPQYLSAFYNMAFKKGVRLNKIKEQLYIEENLCHSHKILFHGAKQEITGPLNISNSRKNNDFGRGFYCGDNLEQSAMFVSNFPDSSLYILDLETNGLRRKTFKVDTSWMITIAYFRGKLDEFSSSPKVIELIEQIKGIDYIIAPIADNRMFEIIDSFIDGDITDIQCQHCLSATNLGNQYVFITEKSLSQLNILEHCYLADEEKQYYLKSKIESGNVNRDKVKVARKQYRGQGKYIEEILQC